MGEEPVLDLSHSLLLLVRNGSSSYKQRCRSRTGSAAQTSILCLCWYLTCAVTQVDVFSYAELLDGWEVCATALMGSSTAAV